jgi:acid stress-induced BolA-like protein IbaG/YrbA
MNSMTPQHIQQKILQGMPDAEVSVTGDEGKFTAQVVSEQFTGLSPIKRHKLVYTFVNDDIASGALHALTIVAKTPQEITAG